MYKCQLESASCPNVTRRHIPPTHQMHAHTHPLLLSLKHTFRNSRMHVPGVRDFPITCQWIPSAWPQTATDLCQITMNRLSCARCRRHRARLGGSCTRDTPFLIIGSQRRCNRCKPLLLCNKHLKSQLLLHNKHILHCTNQPVTGV